MWTALLALTIVAALAVALSWRPSDFVIRLRDGRVECRGKLPRVRYGAIAQFLQQDLKLEKPVKIRGTRQGPRLLLRFRGELSESDRQRIRNFLVSIGL